MISIRESIPEDNERLTEIWLKASINAHDFIRADFWADRAESMKQLYLPNSNNIIAYECETNITVGFISLTGNHIAALFVDVQHQGQGIGGLLINYITERFSAPTLSVFVENTKSVTFYLKHGFCILEKSIDENTGHPEYLMQKII